MDGLWGGEKEELLYSSKSQVRIVQSPSLMTLPWQQARHRLLIVSRMLGGGAYSTQVIWFGLLEFNASATARVISRRWNDDEISFLVEETGVPGGNHRPTASNWWNFSHIQPLPSAGIELGPQRCEAKWAKARWERRLSSLSYRGPAHVGKNWDLFLWNGRNMKWTSVDECVQNQHKESLKPKRSLSEWMFKRLKKRAQSTLIQDIFIVVFPPVPHDWVIKGLGMSSRVCVTG